MDASAADMKSALEALSTIGNLRVLRDDTNNGFKWTVSFMQNVGNLRMMEASPLDMRSRRSPPLVAPLLSGEIQISYADDTVLVLRCLVHRIPDGS